MRIEHKPRLELLDIIFIALLAVLCSFTAGIIVGIFQWIRFFFL